MPTGIQRIQRRLDRVWQTPTRGKHGEKPSLWAATLAKVSCGNFAVALRSPPPPELIKKIQSYMHGTFIGHANEIRSKKKKVHDRWSQERSGRVESLREAGTLGPR